MTRVSRFYVFEYDGCHHEVEYDKDGEFTHVADTQRLYDSNVELLDVIDKLVRGVPVRNLDEVVLQAKIAQTKATEI